MNADYLITLKVRVKSNEKIGLKFAAEEALRELRIEGSGIEFRPDGGFEYSWKVMSGRKMKVDLALEEKNG